MRDFRSQEALEKAIEKNRRSANMNTARPAFMEGYPPKRTEIAQAVPSLVVEVISTADVEVESGESTHATVSNHRPGLGQD